MKKAQATMNSMYSNVRFRAQSIIITNPLLSTKVLVYQWKYKSKIRSNGIILSWKRK